LNTLLKRGGKWQLGPAAARLLVLLGPASECHHCQSKLPSKYMKKTASTQKVNTFNCSQIE